MRDRAFLVSFSGEIGTKSPGTRKDLEELTLKNLLSRARAAGCPVEVRPLAGRLLVRGPEDLKRLLLSHFGFEKVADCHEGSPSRFLSPTFLEEVLPSRPFTYVVYVERKRAGEHFPELLEFKRRLLGVLEEISRARRLEAWDNRPPERVEIQLEPGLSGVRLLVNPIPGLSGLPVGSGGRVLVLFSGGPDSMLATLLLARRGQEVDLLLFDDGEEGRLESVREKARALAYFFPEMRLFLHRFPFREVLEFLSHRVPRRERCFFCKGTMLRLGTDLARREGLSAVATGEILGEQASQTLPALLFTARAAGTPVLRPLLGFNKREVFRILEEMGLGEVSRKGPPPCPFAPDHPHTRPETAPDRLLNLWPEIKKRVKETLKEEIRGGGFHG
ncbi:hypothetical protein [Thermosulfurimonas sp. F29]|uniref:hypothetical protein n=1 Tax=Thermosulfurimonas sp. F29 TaxID=2867247 RepID=UPI001C8323D4|nr:hypothetical protein [Thermosulfurimonas sp. F29]MBX6423923.1 hypothetical protein [Thermosulfurimonas sp. F29]